METRDPTPTRSLPADDDHRRVIGSLGVHLWEYYLPGTSSQWRETSGIRIFGTDAGLVSTSEDFDAPLPLSSLAVKQAE